MGPERLRGSASSVKNVGEEVTIDLGLYTDVLRRHRLLVIIGLLVTVALALLSHVRFSSDGISYRDPEIWSNDATLVLSQPGYPELRSVPPLSADGSTFATPERFASLVDLYAALATSDAVVAALKQKRFLEAEDVADGRLPFSAAALPSTFGGGTTPLMRISATAVSRAEATRLTIAVTDAFLNLLRARQTAAKIPERQRVEVRIVKRSGEPVLVEPRSRTTPIVVLLVGLTIVGAAAFIRDNVRRTRATSELEVPGSREDRERWAAHRDDETAHPVPEPSSAQAGSQLHQADGGSTAAQSRWSTRPAR